MNAFMLEGLTRPQRNDVRDLDNIAFSLLARAVMLLTDVFQPDAAQLLLEQIEAWHYDEPTLARLFAARIEAPPRIRPYDVVVRGAESELEVLQRLAANKCLRRLQALAAMRDIYGAQKPNWVRLGLYPRHYDQLPPRVTIRPGELPHQFVELYGDIRGRSVLVVYGAGRTDAEEASPRQVTQLRDTHLREAMRRLDLHIARRAS